MRVYLHSINDKMMSMTIDEYINKQEKRDKEDIKLWFKKYPQLNIGGIYMLKHKNDKSCFKVIKAISLSVTKIIFNVLEFNISKSYISLSYNREVDYDETDLSLYNIIVSDESTFNKLYDLYEKTRDNLLKANNYVDYYKFISERDLKQVDYQYIDVDKLNYSMTFGQIVNMINNLKEANRKNNISTYDKLLNELKNEKYSFINGNFIEITDNISLINNDGNIPWIKANSITYDTIHKKIEFRFNGCTYMRYIKKMREEADLTELFNFNKEFKEAIKDIVPKSRLNIIK